MTKYITGRLLASLFLVCLFLPALYSQAQDPFCTQSPFGGMMPSSAFFNYGNSIKMKSSTRKMKMTIGQTAVGSARNNKNTCNFGYWGQFLVPPRPPFVIASQGELLDRIQISWSPNPLGPFPVNGFKIFRDGVFLAAVDSKTRNYNDFNVIAGKPYTYTVKGLNLYGEGSPGSALGFQVPNGTVTGQVTTPSGSPVPNALVTLMPMQGFSLKFDAMAGAKATLDSAQSFIPAGYADWTIAFWMKTNSATANAGILQLGSIPLFIQAKNSAGGEGIFVSVNGSTPLLEANFPDSTKNGWHHIALSYSEQFGRLYLDGALITIAPMNPIAATSDIMLGSRTNFNGWNGFMDELRIYHRRLDEIDLGEVMEGTASSTTPGLKYYWKMDEEKGTKSFDLFKRTKLYFCGAGFDTDRPPVRTAGRTTEDGFYRIESASYGTGRTFFAEPMKNFYMHRALKFTRSQEDYALLPDFNLTPKATLELWVNSSGPDGDQCILSKKWGNNDFRLLLSPNGAMSTLKLYLNGTENSLGNLGSGYQHLAFTIDSTAAGRVISAYKNGTLLSTNTFSGVSGNWSDTTQQWVVGARKDGVAFTDYYGGLVDEIAVYDTTLSEMQIDTHYYKMRDMQEKGLRVYFAMDEGSGIRLSNAGSLLTGYGSVQGAEWLPFSPHQKTEPHEFTPHSRQVTLNPSVTSVDLVDFVDRSTVAVTGYVRYKNTDCFAGKVEILVNGASFSPAIFTDSVGRFVIDFDPGTTATLTPKFENHSFIPAFWDISNVSSPIAGILFNDVTTRKISGVVAGGNCKQEIIENPGSPVGTVCIVKVRSKNGCLERTQIINNEAGNYTFNNLPPIECTVAITEFSDPVIKNAFQTLGGKTVDLSKRDTVLDFIYYAPPEAMITAGLDPYSATCNEIVLDQGTQSTITIRVRETYYGGTCDVDTAAIRIINGFSDEIKDTTLSNGSVKYKFKVGAPNPSPPYKKTLQVLATTLEGNESSTFKQAIITGIRSKANTFTTALPETPELILHDPPGDGSYAYLERDSQFCTVYSAYLDYEVGGGGGITFDNGPEIKIVAAPLGVGEIITTDAVISGSIEGVVTYQNISDTSFQVCRSFSQRISTSDDELIVGGQGGDVFVGSGINIDFGFADEITFNEAACAGQANVILTVAPKDYATTFMYSEWNIKKNVVPYLTQLANAATDQTLKAKYMNSLASWDKILKDNDTLKAKAPFRRNISFDAGVVYEYAEASETESDSTKNTAVNSEGSTSGHLGFDLNGVGVTADLKFVYATSAGGIKGNHRQKALKTGYVLADNDPGDAFSVDVAMDSKYNTPVFRTKVGQSSCPHEPNTAHRESANLQLGTNSTATVVDIPSTEAAVYKFFLGNTSETNETRTYALEAKPESNPDGAIIKLNGAVLNDIVSYEVEYGNSIPITITIERGPVAYDYDDLELAFFSACEDDRATVLGIKSDQDSIVYSKILLGAHFIKPCTEVNVNVPESSWLINKDSTLRITVSGYDTTETDFKLIRVQYRSINGDGAWINIQDDPTANNFQSQGEILKAKLGKTFTNFFWKTNGLEDGEYELRAVAICTGDAQNRPGYSHLVGGRIDRTAPTLFGIPQPSDGVYNTGDEISFAFNESIDCAKFGQAIINFVSLEDAATNTPISFDAYCYNNKIVINPNFQNSVFENHILRARVQNIQDLSGNKSSAFEWEFYVDRNELGWLTDSLGMTKYVEQTKTVTAAIHNRGGSPVPFTIQNVPDWIKVVPNAGTLVPNEVRQISFTADSSLAFGLWSDSIKLHTETGQNPFFMGGDEYLPVGVRVICRPPGWDLNAGIFENTMNMVLEVNIQGQKSTDPEDVVGAFINGELRGRANVEYVPQVGKYLAYLTVYGDINDNLDPVLLQVWDASECVLFGTIQESFTFQADNVIGIPTAPQVIHTNSLILREVPFRYGWNWLSFNLEFPNNNINAVLASLDDPDNDLMKSQTQFSTYGGAWVGSLTTIGNKGMYIYKADVPDTLQMLGNMIDPATMNIPLVQGWNWIGYIPNYALPINDALSSVAAQTGDLIKSQTAFAQYINNTFGWVGNLKFMEAPNGYQLKVSTPGTLTYPPAPFTGNPIAARGIPVQAHWSVNAAEYENNSTLIGMLSLNGANITAETMELGAFVGNEVRGAAQAIYVEPLNAYLFFLTTYANTSGELLTFRLYDSATGVTQNLTETMYFTPDNHQGSLSSPVPFSLQTSGTTETRVIESFDIQPNPFNNRTTFRFALPQDEDIALSICDLNGREVSRLRTRAREGVNMVDWDGKSDTGTILTSGIYLVRLETAEGSTTRKVVLQR